MDPLNLLRKIDYKSYKLVHRNDGKTAHVKLYDVRTARYYSTIWMWSLFVLQASENIQIQMENSARNLEMFTYTICRNALKSMTLFSFKKLVVLKETLKRLPADALAKFRKQGLKMEK